MAIERDRQLEASTSDPEDVRPPKHKASPPSCFCLCRLLPLPLEPPVMYRQTAFTSSQGKHDKEKPWDHEGINHWEIQRFSKDENPTGLLEESSFAILFPKYRGEATSLLTRQPFFLHLVF